MVLGLECDCVEAALGRRTKEKPEDGSDMVLTCAFTS